MADLRLVAATTPTRRTSDDAWLGMRGLRDGTLVTMSQLQALVLEGRGFVAFAGVEDAPIDTGAAVDDTLGFISIDVASGTAVIPFWAQAVMAVWEDATLINFMIEVDNAKARYDSNGTAFTPINLRTDSPISSTSTVYRSQDADALTLSAKTAGGSLEIYRESMEVNLGNAGDYYPKMEWRPECPPVVIGPASVIVHFGATSGGTEPTGYGNVQWVEVPSNSIN
tara:strand:- start:112 stop:786 length:675 start_codon:yes stop_codon:yes gene_type:complete